MKPAKWIWREAAAEKNSTARFRKTFFLREAPVSASLTISAHHYLKLWINGTRVGGLVSPASSIFQKHKLTLHYDITTLLQEGENVLAATVLFLGGNGQNRTRGYAGLFYQLEAQLPNGEEIQVVSGEDCRCSGITEYIPGLPMREPRDLTGSTRTDLSRVEPDWKLSGFDDNGWEKAVISPAQYLVGKLLEQEIPEGAVSAIWSPKCIYKENGFWLFDAGELLTGFAKVKFCAPAGTLLRLRYAELLEGQRKTWETRAQFCPASAMRVEHRVANDGTEFYIDEYIAQGGEETWEEDFSYRAFRYLELTGEGVELLSLEVCKAGTDAPCVGAFRCEQDIPDRLAEACIRTQKNAIIGVLVDCPHREQAQYIADSLMQTHLLFYNFPDAPALARKVLRDFADSQSIEGYLAWNSPLDWNLNGRLLLRMPEYDLMYPTLLRDLWFFAGDGESVREYYPVSARIAAYYLAQRDGTGLMPKPDGPVIHISDWPYSFIDENDTYLFMYNAYLIQCLDRMAELAQLLGLSDDACYWSGEANRQRRAIKKHFYSVEKGFFLDTPHSEKHNTAVQVMAFELGLFPEEETQRILRWLPEAPFETCVIMSWDYLCLLFENGFAEEAYRMLTDPTARWGRMMTEGCRTIWEGFEDIESHSHAWNAYPMRLFQQYLLGVSCTKPGFAEATVRPFFPEGVTCLDGTISTIHGLLRVRGHLDGANAEFSISVPEGMLVKFSFCEKDALLAPGEHHL